MIPEHRLAVLLSQVKQNQISKCLYHNPHKSPSLFADHICDRSQFPLQTIRELREDAGEVWFLEFSHNGRWLATSGQGGTVTIYDTETFKVRHMLSDHTDHVPYLTWSPDSSKLITCSHDKRAKVWDINVSGMLLRALVLADLEYPVRTMYTYHRTPRSASDYGCVGTGWPDLRYGITRHANTALSLESGWRSSVCLGDYLSDTGLRHIAGRTAPSHNLFREPDIRV